MEHPVSKSIESRLMVARGQGEGKLELTAEKYRASLGDNGNVLELDNGNWCTSCPTKNHRRVYFKIVNLIFCELYANLT